MSTAISVLTVSQLNKHVKSFLEHEIGLVHVEGEISNLSKPSSGHYYFTLKDSSAQLRCVYFKGRHHSALAANLADGQLVVASGVLSIYEARGDYQLIIEVLQDAGLGVLYQRFEALKKKLAAEGLFDPARKRPLPDFPKTIGIISSPTGAALQDMLSTLARRYPLAKILVYASEVQGTTAPAQLIKALQKANADQRCEVLILARGGGSIEDLWAFNDEQLARHIAASKLPVVTGVGHETDFTIADFVADYRAETPTAAATAVTPDAAELLAMLDKVNMRLHLAMTRCLQHARLKLQHALDKLSSPEKAIATYWQRLDFIERHLRSSILAILNKKRHQFATAVATLQAVSPLATLERGYAIASYHDQVLYSSENVPIGAIINVRLAKGSLACEVLPHD